jgi:hypothetical protein
VKHLTVLLVLIAVTGVNLVFRSSLFNPAAASRSQHRTSKPDRVSAIDQPAAPAPAAAKQEDPTAVTPGVSHCAIDLNRETAREGDAALARIAAECGNHLFEKARLAPDNPHLLNQAAQHYRACLSHEPTCPAAAALFREVRDRLDQVERLKTQREGERGSAVKPKAPVEKPAVPSKPAEVAPPAVEKPAGEKDDATMVGPDGVIYRRSPNR